MTQQAKLRWQCRRGMLELDAILAPFLEQHFSTLSTEQQQDFERLLSCTDPTLFAWFIGTEKPSDKGLLSLVTLIKQTKGMI